MATTSRNLGPGINLLNPFVGVTDFGTRKDVTDEGEVLTKLNVVDYLIANNPTIADSLGHKSTFVKVYKNVDGKVTEVDPSSVTPQDVASGNVMFQIGGKTGGPNRERVAQTYVPKGNQLVPVGEGKFYKGEHPDQMAFDAAKIAAVVLGAYYLGPMVGEALGATGAGTGAAAAGEGVLAGTTAADIMAATEALEAAGATTLGGSAGVPAALTASELAAAGAGAGVPAALSSTAPASLTVAASSLPAATSIIPELATAGVLGGAALTSGTSGTTPDVIDEYNVTGGQGTQIPGGGSLGSPATVATTTAGASILKQLADATGLSEDTLKTILKGGAGLLTGYASYKDAEAAREAAKGKPFKSSSGYQTVTGAGGVTGFKKAASGGIMSLDRGGTVGYTPEGNVDPYASFRRSGGISYKEPSGVNTSFAPFIFGSSDAMSQTGRFDEGADFREPSVESLIQARYNAEYAPEGVIANEVMQRAIEDYPFQFNPNIIPLSKDDALMSSAIDRSDMLEEAKNNILNQVVSIDQITGDIDPVQTIRNVLELEPKITNALPEIQNLQTNVSNLKSQPFGDIYLNQGFKSPYLDEGVSPGDLDAIRYGGENVQNTTKAIGSLLNERFIDPELYKVSYPFIIDESGVPLRDSFGNFITPGSNSEKGGGEGSPRIGPGGGGAAGGIASLQPKRKLPPRYLDGHSDGMADKVPANIDGKRPAALSDGEFVIPADVVSHLGNGNSNAGAKRLYKMMDDIRAARTGNPKQGKQINPDKFMPR